MNGRTPTSSGGGRSQLTSLNSVYSSVCQHILILGRRYIDRLVIVVGSLSGLDRLIACVGWLVFLNKEAMR